MPDYFLARNSWFLDSHLVAWKLDSAKTARTCNVFPQNIYICELQVISRFPCLKKSFLKNELTQACELEENSLCTY